MMRGSWWCAGLSLFASLQGCTATLGPLNSVTLVPLDTPQRLNTGGALVLVPLLLRNGTADTLRLVGCPPIVDYVLERRASAGWVEERRFEGSCHSVMVLEPGGQDTISVPQPHVGSYRAIITVTVGQVMARVVSSTFEIAP